MFDKLWRNYFTMNDYAVLFWPLQDDKLNHGQERPLKLSISRENSTNFFFSLSKTHFL